MIAWLRLAPILIAVAAIAAAFWYRGQSISEAAARERVESQLANAMEENRRQADVIERVTRMRQADDKILVDLSNELARLNEVAGATQAAIVDLERTNEDVRAYLGTVIPDDLRGLLNNR